jgi:LysM repeat protein
MPALAAAGMIGPARQAQAGPGSAGIPAAAVTATVTAREARAAPPAASSAMTVKPARYAVRPGDTLSGIAAALAVRGGWPALYAANRKAIGPDPGLIHPGTVLAIPGQAAPLPARAAPGGRPGRHRRPAPPATAPPPGAAGSPGRPATLAPQPGIPWWLAAILAAAGTAVAAALLADPVTAIARRRRHRAAARRIAAARSRIVVAGHGRVIVAYSRADDTVYVLAPPGGDPRAVLRAARLVLPDDAYEELAGHLGVPSDWPLQ